MLAVVAFIFIIHFAFSICKSRLAVLLLDRPERGFPEQIQKFWVCAWVCLITTPMHGATPTGFRARWKAKGFRHFAKSRSPLLSIPGCSFALGKIPILQILPSQLQAALNLEVAAIKESAKSHLGGVSARPKLFGGGKKFGQNFCDVSRHPCAASSQSRRLTGSKSGSTSQIARGPSTGLQLTSK